MKEKLSAARKAQDLKLWQDWDKEGRGYNPNWEPLFNAMKPLANRIVSKYGGKTDIPAATLQNFAFEGIVDGVGSWDPEHKSKAALSTHVTNAVNHRIRRFVQTFQNPGSRVPEHEGWSKFREYKDTKDEFEFEHGYEPSRQELSSTLGWSLDQVDRMEANVINAQPGTAGVLEEAVTRKISKEEAAIQEVKFQLIADDDKQVFELFLKGKSGQEIARALNMGEGKVSRIRNRLTSMVNREMSRRR